MRRRRGALDFDFPEYKGAIRYRRYTIAHRKTRPDHGGTTY